MLNGKYTHTKILIKIMWKVQTDLKKKKKVTVQSQIIARTEVSTEHSKSFKYQNPSKEPDVSD